MNRMHLVTQHSFLGRLYSFLQLSQDLSLPASLVDMLPACLPIHYSLSSAAGRIGARISSGRPPKLPRTKSATAGVTEVAGGDDPAVMVFAAAAALLQSSTGVPVFSDNRASASAASADAVIFSPSA